MSVVYKAKVNLEIDEVKKKLTLERKGKFIIATNELDKSELSSKDILKNYKNQQSVERGFRFLKDPLFLSSSVFLKKEKRIIALSMIMCLCLLVYMLSQRYLRKRLANLKEFIPNQKNKPTDRPTIRWVFQLFEGVHVLFHRNKKRVEELVLNLNEVRVNILRILGPPYEKMYSGG